MESTGNIYLLGLGLRFNNQKYEVVDHGNAYSSRLEFINALTDINSIQADKILQRIRRSGATEDIWGVCIGLVPLSDLFRLADKFERNLDAKAIEAELSPTQLHLAYFLPRESDPNIGVYIKGHEETHALIRMGELPRLDEAINRFIEQTHKPHPPLRLEDFVGDDEEFVANLGGTYACVRTNNLLPKAFLDGFRELVVYCGETLGYKRGEMPEEEPSLESDTSIITLNNKEQMRRVFEALGLSVDLSVLKE